jgi:hypothetical protein
MSDATQRDGDGQDSREEHQQPEKDIRSIFGFLLVFSPVAVTYSWAKQIPIVEGYPIAIGLAVIVFVIMKSRNLAGGWE